MRKAVESTTTGQPDKVCDQIADAIVDEYLRRDRDARLDLRVLGSHGMLMIGGEVDSAADFDVAELARQVYREIGYLDEIEVFANVERGSEDMRRMPRGASMDTVVVNGYATRETREMLPLPLVMAHTMARRLDDLRRNDLQFQWLQPDGKVQVLMEKDRVTAVTMLVSHAPQIDLRDVQNAMIDRVIAPLAGEHGVQLHINAAGPFTAFGFQADSGISGHKTHVDTYGGLIPHGDHALCGKDPLKAERAGAYMARFAARHLVEQGLVSSALVNVVYTLGRAEPIHVHAVGTPEKSRGAKLDLTEIIKQRFDFRPEAIAERLDLRTPRYREAACFGQIGRAGFPWEDPL